ncbi:MAG: ATP-binding protein [Endomicrobiales bacterium]|nr:ATP-binding protein [Endomicrobiales bacterium]
MKSLFAKLFFSFFIITTLLCVVLLFVSFETVKKQHYSLLSDTLEKNSALLTPEVLKFIDNKNALNLYVAKAAKAINARVTVVNLQGNVLSDSENDISTMDNHKFRPEISDALDGRIGKATRFSQTEKKQMFYVAVPVKDQGVLNSVAVLRLSVPVSAIKGFQLEIWDKILNVALVTLLLSLLLAYILSKKIAGPLSQIGAAASKIATGDFSARVYIKTQGEVKNLADNFNSMGEKIKGLFSELSESRELMNRILSSLEEGIVVFDKNQKIIIFNRKFAEIVSLENLNGKHLWEVLTLSDFTGISSLSDNVFHKLPDVARNGLIYAPTVSLVKAGSEVMLVLFDVTQSRNIEKIKKEFVANVSHELMTPLTAIKGFVETMQEENTTEYLPIVQKNSERLIYIVKDLLLLSKLEEKTTELEKEKFDLTKLVANEIEIFLSKAEQKGIKIEFDSSNVYELLADQLKVEQVIVNLLDNAVKYSESGKISVSIQRDNGYVVLSVKDTGIGIPKESINKIFERFYVVDKSRSKKLGGTGLGLSIVKHIVHLHNGKLEVLSEPGVGSTFKVYLPLV